MEGSADGQSLPPGLADPVVIGLVVAAHGVRGTLRVKAPGAGRHLRRGVEPVVNGECRCILTARETPKGFLVDLEGVCDRDAAATLRGAELLLDRGELDATEEGEFYIEDLIGLATFNAAGVYLGGVAEVLETPMHEILVVRNESDAEHYVPFTFEHVPMVDVEQGRVVIDLREE